MDMLYISHRHQIVIILSYNHPIHTHPPSLFHCLIFPTSMPTRTSVSVCFSEFATMS